MPRLDSGLMGEMMRLAQIIDGTVVNVAEVDPDNVPDFMEDWLPAGDAGPGWVLDGDTLVPPGRSFTPATALTAVLAAISNVEATLTAGVPLGEKLSWTAKEQAAIAVMNGTDTEADTALLAGEASITGETVLELAGRIVAAAEAYRFAASRMAGIRRAAERAIASAGTGEALMQAVEAAEAQCAAIIEGIMQ